MSEIEARMAALREGRAFARVGGTRVARVSGTDAVGWLQDLLTADILALPPAGACRTLLLTPTGRIRADLRALRRIDEIVLLQETGAGEPVEQLLAPYTLTSDVALTPDDGITIVATPSVTSARETFSPSALGTGVDVLVPTGEPADAFVAELRAGGLVEAEPDALERWRILRGTPRMGPDFDDTSIPLGSGLEGAIAIDKGCYLGQESVARVRNLGHPPTALRHIRSDGPLARGDAVTAGGTPAGTVTSACPDAGGSVALVRVTWAYRDAGLQAPDGRPLHAVKAPA